MSTPLDKFLMPAAQKAKRRNSIGGSDANAIMSGDPERILALWEEKMGHGKEQELTLNMLMGTVTEDLNAAWYAHNTGDAVSERGTTEYNNEFTFTMHATLDGRCKENKSIWEAKHTSGFDFQTKSKRSAESMAQYYMPQLQHNMRVCRLDRAVLSVFFDNNRWESVEIEADPFYQDLLVEREAEFWKSVVDKKAPFIRDKVDVAPKVVGTKVVDMDNNEDWAMFAAQWLGTKLASENHAAAASSIKSLLEADVATAKSHGIMAKKDKRGAVKISVL